MAFPRILWRKIKLVKQLDIWHISPLELHELALFYRIIEQNARNAK